jgi:hypothetical protein
MKPCGLPSDPLVKFVETHDVPLPGAPTVGVLYRRIVNFYRSCVGHGWLAQETTEFILVRALLTVYFGTPSMFITLWFGFDYGTNPPLGTLII